MQFRLLAALTLATAASGTSPNQPVYIHLSVLLTDHINIQWTEERLKAESAMLARQSARCPQCAVSASLIFSGAAAEQFADRNKATGLVETVRELVGSGLAGIAYDGIDEPTPYTRPQPNFRRARTPEQRWLARLEPTEWFLTEFKHLLRGDPDPDRSGGLKRTMEVFGAPASVRGVTVELGGDPELVHLLRRMKVRPMLPGYPPSTAYPARNLPGYRGAVQALGDLMSPEPRCTAESFWQDGFLRLSDTTSEAVDLVPAYKGVEPLKKTIAALDRSRKHVIRVQLGHPGLFLVEGFEKTPLANPVRWAYDNPKPVTPEPTQIRPRQETEAAFRTEEALIAWLIDEFIPANPGSRFVSDAALLKLAKTSEGSAVPAEKLRAAAADLLDQWQTIGNHPPSFARAQGDYFSLADMFQMLATALAEYSRTGALPPSVTLLPVYGPFDMTDEQGPAATTTSRSSVMRACTEIAPGLADTAWKPVPENRIPGWIAIDGVRYNAAQFLRAMAETYLSPQGPPLKVPTSQMWSEASLLFPVTRPRSDTGAAWTLKPAPLDIAN